MKIETNEINFCDCFLYCSDKLFYFCNKKMKFVKRNCSCRGLRVSLTLIVVLLMQLDGLFGQIGIGTTTPHPSSCLDIQSQTMGVLLPRMTATEMENIADPYNGLLVFNTNLNSYCIFDSSSATPQWVLMSPWKTDTSLSSNLTLTSSHNIGIGTTNSGFTLFRLNVNGRTRADTIICSSLRAEAISVNGSINTGSLTSQDTIYATSFTGAGAVPSGTLMYWDFGNSLPIPSGWVVIDSTTSTGTFCTHVGETNCGFGYDAIILNNSKLPTFQNYLLQKQ